MTASAIRARYSPPPPAIRSGFDSFGEFLQSVAKAADVFSGPRPQIDSRLLTIRSAAGSSEAVPADGGFLIAPEFSERLITRLLDTGQILSRVDPWIISKENSSGIQVPGIDEQSRADGSRFGGMSVAWSNEADTITAVSKLKFRMLQLGPLKKLIGIMNVTDELLADAGALEKAVSTAFQNEFQFRLEKSVLFGSGQGQLAGVLDPSNGSLITVAKETGQAAGTVIAANIENMIARLYPASFQNAVWLISSDLLPQLLRLNLAIGVAGSALPWYAPASNGESFARLLGFPVLHTEYSAQPGALGDIVLADFSQYMFCQKAEPMTRATSLHVKYLTDEAVLRFTYRADGMSAWHTALAPANGGATQSPFIALAART